MSIYLSANSKRLPVGAGWAGRGARRHLRAGSLVVEHGSREAQKVKAAPTGAGPAGPPLFDHSPKIQGDTHRGSAASQSPGAFLAVGCVRGTATSTVDPG